MKTIDLSKKTGDELILKFVALCIAQDEAERGGRRARFSKLFKALMDIDRELISRGREVRLSLTSLYDHPSFQVRLLAAQCTLAVAPERACAVLASIEKTAHFPQAGTGGMSLWGYQTGLFKTE